MTIIYFDFNAYRIREPNVIQFHLHIKLKSIFLSVEPNLVKNISKMMQQNLHHYAHYTCCEWKKMKHDPNRMYEVQLICCFPYFSQYAQ